MIANLGGITVFEKEAKECEDNDYCANRIIQQTYQQVAETGYSKATGEAKRIIKNLLAVMMCLEGARVEDMITVKEALQYLKEA